MNSPSLRTTLIGLFPELKEKKITISEIIESAEKQQLERKNNKQKSLKILDNIVNKITDGVQKEKIYEINERLVDLSKPMMTEDGLKEINDLINGTLDSTGRDLKNVFEMMKRDGLDKALGEFRYSEFLLPFKKLITREN